MDPPDQLQGLGTPSPTNAESLWNTGGTGNAEEEEEGSSFGRVGTLGERETL